jgi:phosphoenolpyruvate-protein kinase (PTS system EI component)
MPGGGLMQLIKGTPLSPGLAQGLIHVHHSLLGPIDVPVNIEKNNIKEEFTHLDNATARISGDLFTLARHVEEEIDSRLAEVFMAHRLMLSDASLIKELRHEIVDNRLVPVRR